jgi:hypothetical protein
MMCLLPGWEVGGFPVGAVSVDLEKSLGLMATKTLVFLFAGIEGSAAMRQRPVATWAVAVASHHWLIRAGLAAHGG